MWKLSFTATRSLSHRVKNRTKFASEKVTHENIQELFTDWKLGSSAQLYKKKIRKQSKLISSG
jgi:hypothetical protein